VQGKAEQAWGKEQTLAGKMFECAVRQNKACNSRTDAVPASKPHAADDKPVEGAIAGERSAKGLKNDISQHRLRRCLSKWRPKPEDNIEISFRPSSHVSPIKMNKGIGARRMRKKVLTNDGFFSAVRGAQSVKRLTVRLPECAYLRVSRHVYIPEGSKDHVMVIS